MLPHQVFSLMMRSLVVSQKKDEHKFILLHLAIWQGFFFFFCILSPAVQHKWGWTLFAQVSLVSSLNNFIKCVVAVVVERNSHNLISCLS